MTAGPSGPSQTREDRSRFALPEAPIETGRSQPKRLPPKRRDGSSGLVRRIALGVATFAIALAAVSVFYGLVISEDFGGISFENGVTAAIALLIGHFTLSAAQRPRLNERRHLGICLIVTAITPWTYQLGNRLESNGMNLAPGFNFLFEVVLAIALYRLAAHQAKPD